MSRESISLNEWGQRWISLLKPWHVVAIIAFVIAIYLFLSWWNSPEHKIAQFREAVNSGSLTEMFGLASPDEVAHLDLTPAKLGEMLGDTALSPNGVQIVGLEPVRANDAQFRYNRVYICDLSDRQGHPLIDHINQKTQVYLIAYNSTTGWHIALSKFLIGISRERGPGRYANICRQHGVPAEVFEPEDATWRPIAS